MESNQVQVIRQDLRNFSDAVQNMVQGVRAASISWGDQNYQMLFRSILVICLAISIVRMQ